MTEETMHITIVLNGILLAMVAFFAKELVKKIAETGIAISSLDKSVAILSQKLDNHASQFDYFYRFEERTVTDFAQIKERLHSLGNAINKASLENENLKDQLRNKGK